MIVNSCSRRRFRAAERLVPAVAAALALAAASVGGPAPAVQDAARRGDVAAPTFMPPPVGLEDAFQPDFTSADVPVFIEVLGLDDEQRLLLETLFGDYAARFEAGAAEVRAANRPRPGGPDDETKRRQEEMRAEITRMRDETRAAALATDDPEERRRLMLEFQTEVRALQQALRETAVEPEPGAAFAEQIRAMNEAVAAWSVVKETMRRTLIDDARALLRDDQLDRWPVLERRLRRDKTLHRGVLSGESINLFTVIDEAVPARDASVEAEVAPILAAYEVRLDEALAARNLELEGSRAEQLTAMQHHDWERGLAIARRQIGLHRNVREVNEAHLHLLTAALGPDRGADLRAAFDLEAFPRVYRPTRATRMFDAAMGLSDLDERTRAAIQALADELRRTLVDVNAHLREATRTHEPAKRQERYERMAAGLAQRPYTPGEDLLGAAYAARDEMERGYIERLKALVPEDRFASLPGSGVRRTVTTPPSSRPR